MRFVGTIRLLSVMMLFALILPSSSPGWGRDHTAEKEAHLAKGRAALQDGLFDVAEKELQAYMRYASDKAEKARGTYLLARTKFWQGRFNEAAALLRKRAGWAKGTPLESDYLMLSLLVRYEQGKYDETVKLAQEFRLRFPMDETAAEAARIEAKSYLKEKQYDEAIKVLSTFAEDYPASVAVPDSLLDWAGALLTINQQEAARDVLKKLVASYPGSKAATVGRLWLGKLYTDREEWGKAQETLTVLAQQKNVRIDRRASAWFALARVYEAQTNLAEAVQALEELTQVAPDPVLRSEGDVLRGQLLVRMGKVDDGIVLVHQAVRAFPSEQQAGAAQLALAQTLLDLDLFAKADEEYQYYLDAFSDREGRARALLGKAWSLWGLEHYAESASLFDKAYTLFTDPDRKAEARFKAGDSYFAARQYQLASDRYRRVVSEFPKNPLALQARFQIAECLARLDDHEGAEKEFRALSAAATNTPLAAESLLRVAQLKEDEGRWEEAVEIYDEVAEACGSGVICARALHGGGLIRYRLGLFQEALSSFEQIINEYPKSEFAEQSLYMRGWCLYLLGHADEALALCREFIQRYPDSPWAADVLFWLGEYYFNHGEFDRAEAQFLALTEKYPEGALADDALFWAGRAASEQKEYLRAIDYFSKLSKSYPDSPKVAEARFAQGDALSALGKFPTAILAFEDILANYPDSYLVNLAWGRKGDCQFTLSKDNPSLYQDALASYYTVLESPGADRDLKWQAEYKMGRCREKMGQPTEAFDHYMNVVYGYLSDAEKGTPGDPLWFTRAAFNAAAIKEAEEKWREAVNIYKRVADVNVPAAPDARARIQKIRTEHWALFD